MKPYSLAAACVAALLISPVYSPAADFYRQTDAGNNSTGNDWNNTTNYFSQQGSGGTAPSQMAGNDFFNDGFLVRASPGSTANSSTFAGDSLTMEGGALTMRSGIGGTTTVPYLVSNGTTINNNYADATFVANTFINNGTTTLNANVSGGQITNFSFDFLSGAGDLEFISTNVSGGGRVINLSVIDGSTFTGNLFWASGNPVTVSFGNDLYLAGSTFTAESTSRITLDQDVSFGGLVIDGDVLAEGTYTYAFLESTYGDIFNDGGSGSITVVPEPTSGALLLAGLGLLLHRRRG